MFIMNPFWASVSVGTLLAREMRDLCAILSIGRKVPFLRTRALGAEGLMGVDILKRDLIKSKWVV